MDINSINEDTGYKLEFKQTKKDSTLRQIDWNNKEEKQTFLTLPRNDKA